jgi:hypothetical protein
MKKQTFGPVQEKVLTCLAGYMDSTRSLARRVYGLKVGVTPTKSQMVCIHKALRSLEKHELIRLTNQFQNRQRCWELTPKTRPVPPPPEEKKKAAPMKPTLVK